MAGKLNHRYVSDVVDEGVEEEVGPDEWNDSLVLSEGSEGQVPVRRTAEDDGFELEYLGAPPAFVDSTQVGNVSTNETDLMDHVIAAAHLDVNNRALRLKAWGSFAGNANTKTLKLKVGAAGTVTLNPTTTAPNGVRWELEATLIRTGVDTQKLITKLIIDTAVESLILTSLTEDDAVAITVKLTGQSDTASNDILQDASMLEYLG